MPLAVLLTQAEPLNHLLIASAVGAGEILEQLVSAADQLQQPATRGVILLMRLKVALELIDPLGEQSDLHIGRTRVFFMHPKVGNRFRLSFHILHVKIR